MDLAPEYRDRLNSQSPQPNLQEVLFVMGGRSLDDSDDEDDSDEEQDRDPRLQRLLLRNCAFYNTKTSTDIFCTYQNFKFVYVQNQFYSRTLLGNVRLIPLKNSLADVSWAVKRSVDRKTALQECGLDVTKLDHLLSSSNERFIAQSWKKPSMSMFFVGCQGKDRCISF